MSGHQSPVMGTATWLTPPEWIKVLGPFDTDPACPPAMPRRTARRMLSKDGLTARWTGRVWLNPPFGQQWGAWVGKLAQHGNGIALLAARTETRDFFRLVWKRSNAVCFVQGRPHFHFPDGKRAPFNSGAPIALVAYGQLNVESLRRANLGVTILLPEAA